MGLEQKKNIYPLSILGNRSNSFPFCSRNLLKGVKMKLRVYIPCLLTALILLSAGTGFGERKQPLTFSSPKFEIEDLTADLHSDGDMLIIKGKIRNLSHAPVRGYMIIYLKNNNDDTIFSLETKVNKNMPFLHGKTGSFEVGTNIESHSGITNISAEFVEKK